MRRMKNSFMVSLRVVFYSLFKSNSYRKKHQKSKFCKFRVWFKMRVIIIRSRFPSKINPLSYDYCILKCNSLQLSLNVIDSRLAYLVQINTNLVNNYFC